MGSLGACRLLFAALLAACLLALTAIPAAALDRGFADDVWFTGGPSWVQKTAATGARVALVEVDWAGAEPKAPSRSGGPQFNFSSLDPVVREFEGTGVSVAFLVTDAPRWAEARGGPKDLEADGAWRPDARAFGQFAAALASHYDGSHPDPANPGHVLPRVKYFQAWAEPNLAVHLAPQWVKRGRRWTYAAPAIYGRLLNAFYAGVKRVHRDNVVVTAGFAPYGEPIGRDRIDAARTPPAAFLRELLCLSGRSALRPHRCSNPAHFDAYAIDPYETGPPTTHAIPPDDVTAPDLGRLTRIVRKAVRVGTALPKAHKRLWVTEFSYDSNPPNPTAVSLATQAKWLEEAFYIFWRQGTSTVVWYLVRDQAGHHYATSYFSGVYFRDGRPKPSFTAFRFPFVVMGSTAWGIAPQSGTLAVQRLQGGSWRTLFQLHVAAGAVFSQHVSPRLRGKFRALVDGQQSLVWKR